MKSRLLGNTISLILVQIVNYIVPFVVLIHLTKTVGIEIYGVLAFAQGVIMLGAILVDFGYDLSATNKISANRKNKKYIEKIIGGIFLIKFFIFILFSILIVFFCSIDTKYSNYNNVFLLSIFPLAAQSFSPLWFFHGIEKIKYFAIVNICAKIAFAFMAIYFIRNPSDYLLVPVLSGISQSIILIFSIFFIHKFGYGIKIPSVRFVVYCLNFTKKYFISRLAVASYSSGAIIVLGIIAQPAVVAVYSMAEQLYKAMQAALGPVAAASYPYMVKEKDVALMFRLIFGILTIAFAGSLVGFYIAPFFLETFFDKSWASTLPVLNIFFIAIVVHAGAIMTGYPLAAVIGKIDVANSSVITGSVVYFVLLAAAFFLEFITPVNLAIIMLTSEFFVFLHRASVLLPIAIKRWL